MRDIKAQLDSYQDHLDSLYPAVTGDSFRDLVATDVVTPSKVPVVRAAVAFVTALVSVLVLVGVVAYIARGPTAAETAIEVPTSAVSATTVGPVLATGPPTTAPPVTVSVPWSLELFGSAHGLPATGLKAVTVGPDGTAWVAYDEDQAIRLFQLAQQRWAQIGEPFPLGGSIRVMVPIPGGGVAIVTTECDAVLFDGEGWTYLAEVDQALRLDRCTAQTGRDGTSWIFGYEGQEPVLIGIEEDGFVVHRTGRDSFAYPIAEMRATFDVAPDGTAWFGTSEGAWSHDGTGFTFHRLDAGVECCPAKVAVDLAGQTWVQLGVDVFRYTDSEWIRYTAEDGLPDFSVEGAAVPTIVPTSDGTVWILTDAFITRFDGEAWLTYTLPGVSGETMPVGGLPVSDDGRDGTTWVMTYGSTGARGASLYRFVANRWEGGNLNALIRPSPQSGDVDWIDFGLFNRPFAISPDGTVWMATSEGVAKITPHG